MLRVLIITQNEPFFIPKLIRYLALNQSKNFQIIGATVLPPYRKNKNYLHWFKERAKIYSLKELLFVGFIFGYTKLYNRIFPKGWYDVIKLLRENNIIELPTKDINSDEYIKKVKSLDIDVIISISCPQLFKEKLLNSVKYCLNAHGTLLPRHRGVFGSWWTLFSGDKVGGSTIHTMELKLDAGDIIWQKEFPIEKNDTQFSIAYKTKLDMAQGLVEVLEQISINNSIKKLEPRYEMSYHRAPNKEQGKEFHKRGLKIITLNDIKYVLAKNF